MHYGTPDEIAHKLDALRFAAIRCVLLNIAGLSRVSLQTFVREIMSAFAID